MEVEIFAVELLFWQSLSRMKILLLIFGGQLGVSGVPKTDGVEQMM